LKLHTLSSSDCGSQLTRSIHYYCMMCGGNSSWDVICIVQCSYHFLSGRLKTFYLFHNMQWKNMYLLWTVSPCNVIVEKLDLQQFALHLLLSSSCVPVNNSRHLLDLLGFCCNTQQAQPTYWPCAGRILQARKNMHVGIAGALRAAYRCVCLHLEFFHPAVFKAATKEGNIPSMNQAPRTPDPVA
jgi:hypothetical protein